MGALYRAMKKQLVEHQWNQVKTYSKAALRAGAAAAPGPEKTDTSTGRARESFGVGVGGPPTYDPGEKASYRVPDENDAVGMLADWSPGQDIVIGFGVDYDVYFEHIYDTIPQAHEAGVNALRGNDE